MAVTKRTRFEVLRRDGHRCRYCGAGADVVTLVVDHVLPRALGGTDDPSNLAAACEPCNTGKSSTSPDAVHVVDVDERATVLAAAMRDAAAMMLAEHEVRRADRAEFLHEWSGWVTTGGFICELPDGWQEQFDRWRAAGVPQLVLIELVRAAMIAKVPPWQTWRYYAGCAWRRVKQLQDTAFELSGEVSGDAAT